MGILRIDSTKVSRLGLAVLTSATLATVMPGEVSARHVRHIAHHHAHKQVQTAQTEAVQPSNLGAMRYYGGPKSPMWREVGVQTAVAQPTSSSSGGMRYYGGPKSPMWRQ